MLTQRFPEEEEEEEDEEEEVDMLNKRLWTIYVSYKNPPTYILYKNCIILAYNYTIFIFINMIYIYYICINRAGQDTTVSIHSQLKLQAKIGKLFINIKFGLCMQYCNALFNVMHFYYIYGTEVLDWSCVARFYILIS